MSFLAASLIKQRLYQRPTRLGKSMDLNNRGIIFFLTGGELRVSPEGPKVQIPDLSVLYGKSLSPGSLPYLTSCDLNWVCGTPVFRIMVAGLPPPACIGP